MIATTTVARYYLETYGCTSNRGESHQIERQLRNAGHRPVSIEEADVAILNTCTVVETTEDRMYRRIESLAEQVPDLIVTGCMGIAQAQELRESGVDARIRHWDDVPDAVGAGECPTPTAAGEPILNGVVGILPIARGCMSDCSYCLTKHATGRLASPPIEKNVARARELIEAGAKELRITGQDTGVYGWDRNHGQSLLPELLQEICDQVPGDYRIRVGMANPGGLVDVREELAEVFTSYDRLYNFLHIPVQSGADDVLADMRRQHEVADFRKIVATFDRTLTDWTLSTDFMVGFPTETEADFQASMDLMNEVCPEKINVTRFSKRPNTDAAGLDGLGGQTKKDRSKVMSERKREIMASTYQDMVGDRRSVLVVEPGTGDSMKCRDDAYRGIIITEAREHGLSLGDRVTVEVVDAEPTYAFGTLIDSSVEPQRPNPTA